MDFDAFACEIDFNPQPFVPYIAVCPPAPPYDLRLPQLPAHGPPYATWVSPDESIIEHGIDTGAKVSWDLVLVGRGYCGDTLVPANVMVPPDDPDITVEGTWQGDHFYCHDGEMLVLVRGRAEWVPASDGDVPANAFPVSVSPGGETIYCARARVNNNLVFGRVMGSEGACIAMRNRREVAVKEYEVLVIV